MINNLHTVYLINVRGNVRGMFDTMASMGPIAQ